MPIDLMQSESEEQAGVWNSGGLLCVSREISPGKRTNNPPNSKRSLILLGGLSSGDNMTLDTAT